MLNTRNTLTIDEVKFIKHRLYCGGNPKLLSQVHGVNVQTIYDIKNRRTWKNV